MPRPILGISAGANIVTSIDDEESVDARQTHSSESRLPWHDEDVFLPSSAVEKLDDVGPPGFVLGGSVDRRTEEEIKTASEFKTWISDQVIRNRDFLNHSQTHRKRRTEFFENARKVVAESAMPPDERMKTIAILKDAERLLDRP